MKVVLCTHCHSRDLPRLHAPGVLEDLILSHQYLFDEIQIVHQRCGKHVGMEGDWIIKDNGIRYQLPDLGFIEVFDVLEDDYDSILRAFGIQESQLLDDITHGWNWQWYWKHHCVNHLKHILELESDIDYVVFNDADCRIKEQPSSWIGKGIEILQNFSEVFIVSPSDGGHEFAKLLDEGTRLTRTTSQQLFMGRAKDFKALNFADLQWDGKYDADYGPMAEFYGMWEGWMYRWMRKHSLYRAILPEKWRYWHGAWH